MNTLQKIYLSDITTNYCTTSCHCHWSKAPFMQILICYLLCIIFH